MSYPRPDHTRAQLNAIFEQRSVPSLQTPKPTQPFHDVRYQYLLNNQPVPFRPLSSSSRATHSSHSTNPSPSSTLCSTSTLALHDDNIRKLFSPEYSPSYLGNLESPVSPNKASYELWMLPPDVASVATIFPPLDRDYDEDMTATPMQRDFTSGNARLQKKYQEPLPPALPTPPSPFRPVGQRMRWRKPWMDFFDQGCCTRDHDTSVMLARKLVENERWNEERLLDLARVFIWRASDDKADMKDLLPTFASRIRDAFHALAPGSQLSEQFVRTLSSSVLATFVSHWHVHPDHRKAIRFTMEYKPSYITYVVSALCLCSFIGDLYHENFLRRSDTIGCVRIILHNLALVEHLTAINAILRRAGTRLWHEAGEHLDREVEEFRKEMVKAAKKVQDHRFVLTNRAPMRGTVKAKIEALVRYVYECKRFVQHGGAGGGPLRAIRP